MLHSSSKKPESKTKEGVTLNIRIATPQDAALIHETYGHYIAHTMINFAEENPSVEERRDEIITLLENYPVLVAEDESGAFLGFACGEPFRSKSSYRFTVELTIYLHPSAPKRHGAGSALYRALLAMLAEQGYCTALGVIYAQNKPSIALHERFGFKKTAVLENVACKRGQWLDAVIYAKELNPYRSHPPAIIPFQEYRKGLVSQP